MKTIKFVSLIAISLSVSVLAMAQKATESFKVSGNCGMCKTRIEKAAKEAGATEANWDKDSKMLTVSFESSLASATKIQQKIAEVGHDNNGYTASNEVYNNLPPCCKYERTSGSSGTTKDMGSCKDGKKCKKGDKCKDGEEGKDCCKKEGKKMKDGKMDCCKDGKCSKEGHDGKDCCKKS
ncbi:MAG: hypothetical protein HZB42_04235 [Sphingobacteriales bacterium]|nr:hypothetical protein [Sphingobacteriales bacterium]